MRRQLEMIGRGVHRKSCRPRIEMQCHASCNGVETFVFEQSVSRTEQLAPPDAPTSTLFAPHFEQIGEVAVEQQPQIEAGQPVAMVLQPDPLIGCSPP